MNNEQIIKDTAEYNFNLGFQKGKLEQKKELLSEKQHHLNDLKDCDRTEWIWVNAVIKRLEREIKQLQKEIGEEKQDDTK